MPSNAAPSCGAAMKAAERMLKEWLIARGGSAPAEIEAGVDVVRLYLELHGASRFAPWDEDENTRPVYNRAGYARLIDGGIVYYVFPTVWRNDILAGHDANLISRALVERGHIKVNTDGKPQTKQRLPDGTECKVYVVLSSIFAGGSSCCIS